MMDTDFASRRRVMDTMDNDGQHKTSREEKEQRTVDFTEYIIRLDSRQE